MLIYAWGQNLRNLLDSSIKTENGTDAKRKRGKKMETE